MATTVINPPASNNSSDNNGFGFLLGIIVLIVFAALFFVYVLPTIRGSAGNNGVQVDVPKSIDVNVKQTK